VQPGHHWRRLAETFLAIGAGFVSCDIGIFRYFALLKSNDRKNGRRWIISGMENISGPASH